YLKGTPSLGLYYSDSDYVGCNMDRKSTSCACQILGGSWLVGVLKNSSQWLCPHLRLNMLLLLVLCKYLMDEKSTQ
ncbi:hypothetical protein Tco_0394054, partial [Tanacetum coccineum]